MFLNLQDWQIDANYFSPIEFPILNFYNKNSFNFTNSIKSYKEEKYEQIIETLEYNEQDIDHNILYSMCFIKLHRIKKALHYANKAILIGNSYHAFFHYFGFNVSINLYNLTKEERYFKKAEFLYKEGLKENLEIWQDCMKDAIKSDFQKDICIFQTSRTMQLALKKDTILEAYEQSNIEHFEFHLSYALAYFLRGLCFLFQNQKETAKMDFEKAKTMELQNPFNSVIEAHLK